MNGESLVTQVVTIAALALVFSGMAAAAVRFATVAAH